MNKLRYKFKKISTSEKIDYLVGSIVIIVVAIVGSSVFFSSHADSPAYSKEAESGNLTSPAKINSDSNSSGGKNVQFGDAFNVSGNKILGANGTQFVPYGFVLPCAATFVQPNNISTLCLGDSTGLQPASQIITAASKDWNANVIRVQVSQEDLFSETTDDTCTNTLGSVNQNYADLINSLVGQINSQHMIAIITLQEELAGGCAFPTTSSTAFWNYMANNFKNNPDVFFDLFNEPQLGTNATSGVDVWQYWQNGGTGYPQTDNSGVCLTCNQIQYVGMQSLVNTIRSQGANNIVIAEGNDKDQNLSELTSHYLNGSNIAYGTEPSLRSDDVTPTSWMNNWGQYAASVPILPEAFIDTYGDEACDPNSTVDMIGTGTAGNPSGSPTNQTQDSLFYYLKSLNMGLISWNLGPGVDVQGSSLTTPTNYIDPNTGTTFTESALEATGECRATSTSTSVDYSSNDIGPGALLQQYFEANSIQLDN